MESFNTERSVWWQSGVGFAQSVPCHAQVKEQLNDLDEFASALLFHCVTLTVHLVIGSIAIPDCNLAFRGNF
jgi:hypothetical protein